MNKLLGWFTMIGNHKSSEYIIPIIYRKYMDEELKRLDELRNPHVIYVTEIVGCSHKYKLRTIYPELMLRFDPSAILGELVHIGLERYLGDTGFMIEYSIENKYVIDDEEYYLRGRVDAYDPGRKLVVEIKSSRDASNKPFEHHILQLQVYLNMLESDNGILLYITPDGLLEYSIKREKLDLKSLIKMLVRDEVHPKYGWECRYCVYRRMCIYAQEAKQANP